MSGMYRRKSLLLRKTWERSDGENLETDVGEGKEGGCEKGWREFGI